jgi:hypothetical protein
LIHVGLELGLAPGDIPEPDPVYYPVQSVAGPAAALDATGLKTVRLVFDTAAVRFKTALSDALSDDARQIACAVEHGQNLNLFAVVEIKMIR